MDVYNCACCGNLFTELLVDNAFCSIECFNKTQEVARREQEVERSIKVWRWKDAPERFKALSEHGGPEGWVFLVPRNPQQVSWLEACDITECHKTDEGMVYISADS